MKKILLFSMLAVVPMMFINCQSSISSKCHIHGRMANSQYEGRRIFLVPLEGPQDAAHVDSVVIKDGKFEFTPDSFMLAKILVDYHYRYGLQPLLVVTEPGDVDVVIGENSSATGTPQNDSLQLWKSITEAHNKEQGDFIRTIKQLSDTIQQNLQKARADSAHLVYKKYTRQMAENLKEGPLHEFLKGLYPTTYKRKMPDGSVVTVDADTKEILK
ncbi:MAG: DUF4369 domain-containing protein [Prevotella sp.]|nr:DUF4369 domain-containing protein [Prevotella sp.]